MLSRSLRFTLLLLALVLAGVVVAAWVGDDPEDLPFAYEGFD